LTGRYNIASLTCALLSGETTTVRRYHTEVVIPADRTLVLHLPNDLPEGDATLIVQMVEPSIRDASCDHDDDLTDLLHVKDQDIEWWEEFEDVAS
jgi:hypothetical protein